MFKTLLGAAAAVIVLYVLYSIIPVLLIGLAGVLFAVLLNGIACHLARRSRLPRWAALIMVLVMGTGGLVFLFFLLGPQLLDQMSGLSTEIPNAIGELEDLLDGSSWGAALMEKLSAESLLQPKLVGGFFGAALGSVSAIIGMLVIGLFLALNPDAYVRAAVKLVPPRRRERAKEVLGHLYAILKLWLLARVLSMVVVGVLTLIGLFAIGLPMTLALALIAALMSFIPFIGPILSVFPALLIGLLDGPATALWVAVIYSVVQILEGNLVTPIIERRTLHVPPAALLLGQMVMALLFGFFGVLLATPLLVIGITLVQMLYIEDVLGERVTPLGGD